MRNLRKLTMLCAIILVIAAPVYAQFSNGSSASDKPEFLFKLGPIPELKWDYDPVSIGLVMDMDMDMDMAPVSGKNSQDLMISRIWQGVYSVRAAIYKELKGLEYRELEFHQIDSRVCAAFIKIDELRPYSFHVYQKYISRIKADSIQKLLVELNKIAISAGIEDIERIRQDSTVVETNIHYPTNNSILWDCIKEAYRLLAHLSEEVDELKYRDYTKQGKKTCFKINNTKGDKRKDLFNNQLILFVKTINQVSNVIKKKPFFGIKAMILAAQSEEHIEVMRMVYDMAYLKEIKGEKVPNEEKIYSIYERHTDIIVKGSRDIKFGHKVDFSSGKSNLVLNCQVLRGNPSDSKLFAPAIDAIIGDYGKVPRDCTTDGGYASLANQSYAKGKGIINIVFNKIVGSLANITTSKNMETRLKKWRSGMEAVISNIKRGFNLDR